MKEKKTEVIGVLEPPECKMSLLDWTDFWNKSVDVVLMTEGGKHNWYNLKIEFIQNYDAVDFELSGDRDYTEKEIAASKRLQEKRALRAKVEREKKEARDRQEFERLKKKFGEG
jgi:hypothetical protein